jgi:hypothetical protein
VSALVTAPRRPRPADRLPLSASARRARRLAREVHGDEVDAEGRRVMAVVEAVAQGVPESARRTAFVHRAVGRTLRPRQLAALLDLDDDERDALALLVRRAGEDGLAHARRLVAQEPRPARELALVVAYAALAEERDRRRREDARRLIRGTWTLRS